MCENSKGKLPVTKSEVVIPPIALFGQLASGKGTYADHLRKSLESEFGVVVYEVPSFSDKISEIARDLFAMEGKDRDLLQVIGAKMREIDPQVWAKYLIRDIKTNVRIPFVVEGFRDPNELQAFRDNFPDIVVIGIEADKKQRMDAYKNAYGRYPTTEQLAHSSEKAIEQMHADITLFNTYTQENLAKQVAEIVAAIKDKSIYKLFRS